MKKLTELNGVLTYVYKTRKKIAYYIFGLQINKCNFRRLLNKKNPPSLHRTGSGTITGTTLVEKRYQWSRKRFWDLICAGRTISFTTACVSTVPNSSSGLTVHSKHVFGLQSCSLRKEHPTVSALKSTAISAHHKILTFARSVTRCHQNCIIFQLTVKPYHKISLNLTLETSALWHSDVRRRDILQHF